MKVQTIDLARDYSNGDTAIRALEKCTLSFEPGEQTAIMGTSGSGKTTLLNLIGGLDFPSEGKVLYDNIDIFKLTENRRAVFRRQNIGFVFQAYNLIPELTARENIILPLVLDNSKVENEFFDHVTEALGLTQRLSHLPGELSGGQQQRVAIARAVIHKPSVLLCDEPTGNLDSSASLDVIRLLKALSSELRITNTDCHPRQKYSGQV